MRRAVLAILLCAAPLATAPVAAAHGLPERQALREALRLQARAAAPGAAVVPLPLPERDTPGLRASAASAASGGELARIARARGPQRVLVGVRSHGDMRGVASALRRLGGRPEAFTDVGVLAATVLSGPAAARALGADPRVAYLERDSRLRVAADPFDALDPQTGEKYTWFYDEVRAAEALVAAGGRSARSVAVLDSGLDLSHPELAGRWTGLYDTLSGGSDVTDVVGHGTFISGLISGIDGNGYGGKGVAGDTKLLAIRASRDGTFTETDLLRGIAFTLRGGGDILNMSLAGEGLGSSVARALGSAFYNDVLPVAASGNLGATARNPPQFPAVLLGGRRGATGIGLSVSATRPGGVWADFSTHNEFVSIAAPGAGPNPADDRFGVLSSLPASATDWDDPRSRSLVFSQGGVRFAYAEGTSFSAPIVSGLAALVWQVERRLASEQVAEVLTRSARQTRGRGWNRYTGAGLVDGAAATALARRYDVRSPRAKGRAWRGGGAVRVRVARSRDRTERGRELAGRVRYGLLVSRDGGRTFRVVVSRRRRAFTRTVALSGRRPNVFLATACDGNGNCGIKRLGRFRR